MLDESRSNDFFTLVVFLSFEVRLNRVLSNAIVNICLYAGQSNFHSDERKFIKNLNNPSLVYDGHETNQV